jgi:hypothetical protein
MDRIQTCNFNTSVNLKDVNEFGILARIDALVTDPPSVGLDFSYYLTDGYNERLMGFNVAPANGVTDGAVTAYGVAQSVSGLLQDVQGNNFYILTVDDGDDVDATTAGSLGPTSNIIGIGNGFISDYKVDLAVGQFPTASVTVEGFNIKCDANVPVFSTSNFYEVSGLSPAVNPTGGTKITNIGSAYTIQEKNTSNLLGTSWSSFTTGYSTVSAIRQGDILLELPASTGFADISTMHVQSVSFSIPMRRTILQRLGNTFGFARVIDVPINAQFSISALQSEFRSQNLADVLTDPNKKQPFRITLKDQNGNPKMRFGISGAIFQSERHDTSIGPNSTTELTYGFQIGGASDTVNGLFISGSSTATQLDSIVTNFFPLGTGKV